MPDGPSLSRKSDDVPRSGRWWSESGWDWKHYGPMHGERTARHQKLVVGNSRRAEPVILTLYEHEDESGPRQYVEVQVDDQSISRLHLTVTEAREMATFLTEFADAWERA